jgi:hypothetical protein
MRRGLTIRFIVIVSAVAAIAGSAGASPAAVDLELNIGASNTFTGAGVFTANGGSVSVTRRTFVVHLAVDLITTAPGGHPTFQVELGDGLRWGATPPGAADGCTSTVSTAECRSPFDLQPVTGQTGVGFYWEVVAPQNGSYAYKAEIVDAADVDPVVSNNASSITIVVGETTGGGGTDTTSVTASAVKLSPTKSRAGSVVVASVRVTKGGSPVRPTGITCAASIGKVKTKGSPKATSGVASCLFKPPKSAKGKTMTGSISFRAGGAAFTKRFATKLS